MLVRLMAKGINYFVDEDNTYKIRRLRDDFKAVPELDNSGAVKRYSDEEFRRFMGYTVNKVPVESIFGVKVESNKGNTKGVSK